MTKQTPVLDIDAGQTEISLSLADKEIRASAVEFAAELARAASQFAAEVERRTPTSRSAASHQVPDPAA